MEEPGVEGGGKSQADPRIAPEQVGGGGGDHPIDVYPGVAAGRAEIASSKRNFDAGLGNVGLQEVQARPFMARESEIGREG
jgi:hypothetical protein